MAYEDLSNQSGTIRPLESIPIWSITVYGNPVAQARPRTRIVRLKTGQSFAQHYDKKESRDYKSLIRDQILLEGKPETLIDEPLSLECRVYRLKPKSKPKKVKHPVTKPDLDNYLKSVIDALTGIVIRDDSIIIRYKHVEKLYTETNPRVEITLYSM